jgi:DNA-binding transcriptional LysR family regulator
MAVPSSTLAAGMVELRHLRYFVAVAEELHFSRAADRLHMAQPPLSAAIRQLEQQLGTELLLRTSREVRLTEAGRRFLDGARRTLAELERAQSDARRAAAGDTGRLRIGFSWSMRFDTLPALGRAMRASHPDVELLTEEMWNARMLPSLRSGAIDAALALCPEIDADFSYEPIRSETLIAVVADTHPLAGRESAALNALAGDAFLMFPRELGPRLYDFMVAACRRAGFEPRIRHESFHSGWEMQILADVPVVALAPACVARALPQRLSAVEISDPAERLESCIIWRSDDDSPVSAALRSAATSLFKPASSPHSDTASV